ncbi:MAG: response regulator transcription factor [Steroidobacteraceae bacterium]
MSVSERQYQGILKVVEHLGSGADSHAMRERAGLALLELLNAEYFASYIWNPQERRFGDHVFINMDPKNLERYESYYQFHDPITGNMQKFRRAICVNEVMPREELLRTEFYNDFLARDGLYYGINLYVYDGDNNIGDLRIWRSRRRSNFDVADLHVLELIKPHFCNAMRNILRLAHRTDPQVSSSIEVIESDALTVEKLKSIYGLTRREAQIAIEVAHGKTDQEIAAALSISFSTIRTHINHVYDKLGVRNRTSLVHAIARSA